MMRMNVTLACAGALLATSLVLPALAETGAAQSATEASAADRTDVPIPKARPAPIRKRIASAAPVRRVSPPPAPYWYYYRPYERVAVHWPILFIGVGF